MSIILAQSEILDNAPTTPWGVSGVLALALAYCCWKLWQQREEPQEVCASPYQAPACKLDHSGIAQTQSVNHKEAMRSLDEALEISRRTAATIERVSLNLDALSQQQERMFAVLNRSVDGQSQLAAAQERLNANQSILLHQQQSHGQHLQELLAEMRRRRSE